MVHALEPRDARHASAPACLRHRDEVEDLFDARVQERHAAHDAWFVRREERERRQEIVCPVARF